MELKSRIRKLTTNTAYADVFRKVLHAKGVTSPQHLTRCFGFDCSTSLTLCACSTKSTPSASEIWSLKWPGMAAAVPSSQVVPRLKQGREQERVLALELALEQEQEWGQTEMAGVMEGSPHLHARASY